MKPTGTMHAGRVLALVGGPSLLVGILLIILGSPDDWHFWMGVGAIPAVAVLNIGVLLLARRRYPLSRTLRFGFWLSVAVTAIASLIRPEDAMLVAFGCAIVLRIAWWTTFADVHLN